MFGPAQVQEIRTKTIDSIQLSHLQEVIKTTRAY